MSQHRIAIFVSGTGSNARVIIDAFSNEADIDVVLLVSSKPNAKALLMAAERDIPTLVLERKSFRKTDRLLETLAEYSVNFIVLAGFLWLVPKYLVTAFPKRMVNIHPALLPKYGGKGMYGMHVHRAVKEANEKESGITIHYVNEQYDEGAIIFQEAVSISSIDSPATIAAKVLALEHKNYARIVRQLLDSEVKK